MLWLLSAWTALAEPIQFRVYGPYTDGKVYEIDVLRYLEGLSPDGNDFCTRLSLISPFFDTVQRSSPELLTIREIYAEKLRSAAHSKNPVNRTMALWCFKQIPEFPSNWEVLESACSDRDIRVRSAAISVLALIDRPEAFAILKRQLLSPEAGIRYDCCSAVLRMSPKYHFQIQEELLELCMGKSSYAKRSKQLYKLYFGPLPAESPASLR